MAECGHRLVPPLQSLCNRVRNFRKPGRADKDQVAECRPSITQQHTKPLRLRDQSFTSMLVNLYSPFTFSKV
jgi:hypothetical protein